MPEYLAPGVYVEEVSFRAKSIEGVSTSTTGFAGPSRKGPLDGTPEVITSFGDFQRIFGGFELLDGFPEGGVNYIAQGVQNYFDNGGSRLYFARVFQALADDNSGVAASAFIGNGNNLRFLARFPGGAGNGTLTLREILSPATVRTMGTAPQGSVVRIGGAPSAASLTGGPAPFNIVADGVLALTVDGVDQTVNIAAGALTVQALNALVTPAGVTATADAQGRLVLTTVTTGAGASITVRGNAAGSVHADLGLGAADTANGAAGQAQLFRRSGNTYLDGAGQPLDLAGQLPGDPPRVGNGPQGGDFVSIRIEGFDGDRNPYNYEDLGLDRAHPRFIGSVLALQPSRRADQLENIFAVEIAAAVTAADLHARLFGAGPVRNVILTGGNDGAPPLAAAYRPAFERLTQVETVSIVAAPGHSTLADFQAIQQLLIAHAEGRRAYRIAVLDTPPDQTPGEASTVRSRIDSTYAALYYPWVVVANPLARPGDENIPREVALPPSGFLCGIYARNDIERGVAKTPANEVLRGAIRMESDINFGVNEVLNPIGVNCLRYFPNRGFRVWGGRTVSSDPEFKYVNVRRYMVYVEASVDRGTQWAVFENNGERLWANVRQTVSDFLYNEWSTGSLLGGTPKEAFFVRCDRSTMTQNDLDNGRLVCLVGIAVLKPAEFVIFRIGQKTADARS